jgi:hypothetical protein
MSGSRRTGTTPPEGSAAAKKSDDRPTLTPGFDPEAFARDSEIRQRVSMAVEEGQGLVDRARALHDGGDHEQALFLVDRLLELEPHHPGAARLSMECRAALERECLGVVGSEATVLVLAVTIDELKSFALDRVSGFLLSLADGSLTVEAILDASGLPRLLALRHLRGLCDRGLLSAASGHRRPPVPLAAQAWANRKDPKRRDPR